MSSAAMDSTSSAAESATLSDHVWILSDEERCQLVENTYKLFRLHFHYKYIWYSSRCLALVPADTVKRRPDTDYEDSLSKYWERVWETIEKEDITTLSETMNISLADIWEMTDTFLKDRKKFVLSIGGLIDACGHKEVARALYRDLRIVSRTRIASKIVFLEDELIDQELRTCNLETTIRTLRDELFTIPKKEQNNTSAWQPTPTYHMESAMLQTGVMLCSRLRDALKSNASIAEAKLEQSKTP